jgi:hypothetical protein
MPHHIVGFFTSVQSRADRLFQLDQGDLSHFRRREDISSQLCLGRRDAVRRKSSTWIGKSLQVKHAIGVDRNTKCRQLNCGGKLGRSRRGKRKKTRTNNREKQRPRRIIHSQTISIPEILKATPPIAF